ncbi:hypothetical protein JOQ06_028826 [Pogonophryne albipinna]|uniref:Uncharacterized protein n=1 Tax=Pogonophryne albipinna TaxID=1090488 RepID=A0AAD6B9Q4_9TELE|nr:hypothetical protein JOQ06_028826 [Pogonophryne albipinna]
MSLILKELREFRKDNGQQLKEIRKEINKTNNRIAEAEGRIEATETRLQVAVTELLQLQVHLDAKLTDLEGRSRRENIRIHGVKEGAEDNSSSMGTFVEALLREGLDLPATFELRVERAHRALMPKPPGSLAEAIGIVVYGSAEEATEDMAKRGLPVSVIKHQIHFWNGSSKLPGAPAETGTLDRAGRDVNYKEKLGAFRHKDSA